MQSSEMKTQRRGFGKTNKRPNNKQQRKSGHPSPGDFNVTQPGMVLTTLPMGFPYKTRGTLRYCDSVALAGSASATTAYTFSANGIFDPDVTGTGHQPMFFDSMMTIYNHYTVQSSRIKVIGRSTVTGPARIGVMVTGATSVSTDFRVNLENGEMSYALLEVKDVYGSASALTKSVNAFRFQGVVKGIDDPDMRGDAASNPAEQFYFALLLWNPESAAVPSCIFDVAIEYDVIFHEPRKGVLS